MGGGGAGGLAAVGHQSRIGNVKQATCLLVYG